MNIIIDRIEEGIAVAELPDGSVQNIPLSQLPHGVTEGTHLMSTPEGWKIDPEATAQAKARVRGKLDRLLKKSK
jgi:hypothetical protein